MKTPTRNDEAIQLLEPFLAADPRHLAAFDMLPQTSHVELLVALAPL